MIRFFLGVDLGKANDYSAAGILEQELKPYKIGRDPVMKGVIDNTYLLRYLKRWKHGTPYPMIVEDIYQIMQQPIMQREGKLIVDVTGVGEAVADMLRLKKLRPVRVFIHGGEKLAKDEKGQYNVPKADLVAALAVLFHSKRIRIAGRLPEGKLLKKEVEDFEYTISRRGHVSYGAEGEGENDDLVLSVSLAAWYALRGKYQRATIPGQEPHRIDERENTWDPLGGVD